MSERVLHKWKAPSGWEYELVATTETAVLQARYPAEDPRWTPDYGSGNDVANELARLVAEKAELLDVLREVTDRLGIHMLHTEDLVAHMRACKLLENKNA